jgi:hypothetical protein
MVNEMEDIWRRFSLFFLYIEKSKFLISFSLLLLKYSSSFSISPSTSYHPVLKCSQGTREDLSVAKFSSGVKFNLFNEQMDQEDYLLQTLVDE